MAQDFGLQVSAYVETYKKRMRATAREAVEETVAIAQEERPPEGSGRMPIITGFLRASLVGKVGSMPAGQSQGDPETSYEFNIASVSAALLTWDPNDGTPFFAGWTAVYARQAEYRHGFMRGATELWTDTVERVAKQVSKRI